MHKVGEAMKSSSNYPIKGKVEFDEFAVGGKETGKLGRSYNTKKRKAVCAVEYTDAGKVKRIYTLKIKDYSAKKLKPIFDKHLSKSAEIKTDEWKGYVPLKKAYSNRKQIRFEL